MLGLHRRHLWKLSRREVTYMEESDTLIMETLELKALVQGVGLALDVDASQALVNSEVLGSREIQTGWKARLLTYLSPITND